jgi:DNA-directed RNA polymerase subunit RPC12/RpoP
MLAKKYICNGCRELFLVRGSSHSEGLTCPRCAGKEVLEYNACGLEIGPPPWEFLCRVCGGRFNVKSPDGPDEARQIRCPRCKSPKLVWLAQINEACPTGV